MDVLDIPFNLVEILQELEHEYLIIDTLEKNASMALTADIEVIFNACQCAQYCGSDFQSKYALIIDILNSFKAFDLCEDMNNFWTLTKKGQLLQMQIGVDIA